MADADRIKDIAAEIKIFRKNIQVRNRFQRLPPIKVIDHRKLIRNGVRCSNRVKDLSRESNIFSQGLSDEYLNKKKYNSRKRTTRKAGQISI